MPNTIETAQAEGRAYGRELAVNLVEITRTNADQVLAGIDNSDPLVLDGIPFVTPDDVPDVGEWDARLLYAEEANIAIVEAVAARCRAVITRLDG